LLLLCHQFVGRILKVNKSGRRSDKLEHKRAGKVVAGEEGGGGSADEEGGGIRRWQSVAAVTRKTTRRKAQGEV